MAQELQVEQAIDQLVSEEESPCQATMISQIIPRIIELEDLPSFAKCVRSFLSRCLILGKRLMMLVHFYDCQTEQLRQEKLGELLKKFISKYDREFEEDDFRSLEIVSIKLLSLSPFFVSAEKIFIEVGWQLHQSFEINFTLIYQKALVRSKSPLVHRVMQAVEKFRRLFVTMNQTKSQNVSARISLLDSELRKYQRLFSTMVN
jgi:hypothetical protein